LSAAGARRMALTLAGAARRVRSPSNANVLLAFMCGALGTHLHYTFKFH
jgi:hypothetical protein